MVNQTTPPQAAQPRASSAVMLLRDAASGQDIEVFMVRRVIQSDFMPDVYVFPGGSVSADDRVTEGAAGICMPIEPTTTDPEGRTALGRGIRAAAIRELFEEAGVLLAYCNAHILAFDEENILRFEGYRQAFNERKGSLAHMAHAEQIVLATHLLAYFAHWITPEGMPKRFDTHFFITTAPDEQQAAHDHLETSEGVWISPREALAGYERGAFPLVFATIRQLAELAAFTSVKDTLARAAMQRVATHTPILVQENGAARVYLPEDEDGKWNVPDHMIRN